MKRLAAIIVGAIVVGGLGGAAMASALVGSGDSASTPQAVAGAPAVTQPATGLTPEAIYRRAAPGVVVISATQTEKVPGTFFAPPSSQEVQVSGSDFVIDRKGDIVTNDHVIQGAGSLKVGFSGGATYGARIVGADPSTDLAVIRVQAPASALDPLALADSAKASVGDTVYAIGNPFGLDRTMTAGIVSAVGRDIQAPNGLGIPDAIQTDAPINHGNSGGPLLDTSGRVVGINDQIDTGGAVNANVGVGFAVASNTAASVVPQLLARGRVAHAWLGVEVGPIDPQVARAVRGIPDHGVLVLRVVKGSPAARAGLEAGSEAVTVNGETVLVGGDAITELDGAAIRTPDQLANLVRSHKPGDELTLQADRRGNVRDVHVTLGTPPARRHLSMVLAMTNGANKVRVVAADDHPLYRKGVVRALVATGQIEVLAEAEDGRQALAQIEEHEPEVAVLDYKLPDLDGLQVTHAIVRDGLPTRVLMLSAFTESSVVYKALETGVAGYLPKEARREQIADAVLACARGEHVVPPEVASGLVSEIRLRATHDAPALIERERQVLKSIRDNLHGANRHASLGWRRLWLLG